MNDANQEPARQAGETAPPRKSRKRRGCLWLLMAVVAGVIIALMPDRPPRAIATYQLSPDLDLELLQVHSEHDPTFTYSYDSQDPHPLRNRIVQPIIKILPRNAIRFLFDRGFLTVKDFTTPSLSHHSFTLSNNSMVLVPYRFSPSSRLLEVGKSDVQRMQDEMMNIAKAADQNSRFRFILASPDLRYQSKSEPFLQQVHSVTGTPGTPGYEYEWNSYGALYFQGVPVRYQELDLIFLEMEGREIVSSSTMKIKNPRYRAKLSPPPGPVQPLPASAESHGLSLTLSRFVKDTAPHQHSMNSNEGENGREIWERGDALKDDITLGRPGGTSMQIAFHDHGTTTTDWRLSDTVFYDETGTTISSGGWTGDLKTGLYTHVYNVGALSSPLKTVISATQFQNWPDADYTTHTFAVPPIKPDMPNQISESMIVGPHSVDITEMQFSGVGTSTGSGLIKSLSISYAFLRTDDNIVATEAHLLSETTSPLVLTNSSLVGSGGGNVGQSTQIYRFSLPDYVTTDTLAAYTSISLTLVHAPVRRFELIVEPEEATTPVMEGENPRWWTLL